MTVVSMNVLPTTARAMDTASSRTLKTGNVLSTDKDLDTHVDEQYLRPFLGLSPPFLGPRPLPGALRHMGPNGTHGTMEP